MSKQKPRINERIRVNQVRLIDEGNNQVGVVATEDALSRARDTGLDLVEVAPNSEPPVCKIMDFGKYLYEQKKKTKQSQKKQHVVQLKEVRLRPKIDPHDLEIKVNRAHKFLEKGNKVQFSMLFRGREMIHIDHGREMMQKILETLGDLAKVERSPKMAGRRLTMVVAPTKV